MATAKRIRRGAGAAIRRNGGSSARLALSVMAYRGVMAAYIGSGVNGGGGGDLAENG